MWFVCFIDVPEHQNCQQFQRLVNARSLVSAAFSAPPPSAVVSPPIASCHSPSALVHCLHTCSRWVHFAMRSSLFVAVLFFFSYLFWLIEFCLFLGVFRLFVRLRLFRGLLIVVVRFWVCGLFGFLSDV